VKRGTEGGPRKSRRARERERESARERERREKAQSEINKLLPFSKQQ